MRKKLKALDSNKRYIFVGTFDRFGAKSGYKGVLKTILLKDIHFAGDTEILTDHLWFNATKGFEKANPKHNDLIQFDGRIDQYQRGYDGYRQDVYVQRSIDYKICFPTKIINLSKEDRKEQKKN